ncbi:SPOR domain-containing protein [Massilia sp. TW-1]|uniref:SPOR domain-containing protein n=1 Tax=Telluria antibiotica TaxID=2717319 RepID=A0ABX0PHY4_9BURK|nr:SPOR domain-containing protein [Telluria antibiotica]NIA56655.1 SPOR domain-containing protein [Telluria antibiotica]
MTAFRNRSPRSFTRRRGSTLTGLIIGLILGLGIAVAVALTITKGASPFTDKTVKAGRPADPAPGQAQDPNKPMYANRDAARQANKEIAEKAATRTDGAPAAADTKRVDAKPADADPLGQAIATMKDAAPAKPDHKPDTRVASASPTPAPAPAAGAATGDYVYYLQAGAFRDVSDAEAARAKLALLGFEAAISDRTSDSGVLHRVRIGPYNQVEAMNKARAKLLDSGVDVAIVRNQR